MEPTKTPRVLSGRYELSHLVARGGMAEVYRARDQLLDRPVALKVLFPELSVDRSFVERFRREAQAAANLSHPNIVPVFDWGEDGGTYFIVMEFVDGRPLSSILRTAGPLHPDRAAEIAADVAGALSYAHRHGVVHRDVKPGNVLITEEGTIKVTDFGIARAVNTEESLTQTGAVMGTATYFSPEQAEGMGVDSRSDIYSLGVVLFEMVTGRPPFLGDTPVAVASKHVREHPPAPREINPAVPPDLEAIILKCMAKSPDHRYATGDDLRMDLLRFREGRVVGAVAPQGGPQTTQAVGAVSGKTQAIGAVGAGAVEDEREPSRTRLYAAILGLLLVALAVVVIFLGNSLGWWHLGGTSSFSMPDVVNQTVTQAERTLQHEGLHTQVQADRTANNTPNTQVLRTQPTKGTTVRKGQTVTIVTGNRGPQVQVPPLVNQSVTAAKAQLQQEGLQANVQFSNSCTQQNIVCDQSPKSGTGIAPGGTVNIFTAPTTTAVPDVTGLDQNTACNRLGQAGFQCGTITQQASSTVPPGNVISTNPAAGAQEPANASVNLVVSHGPSSVLVPDTTGSTQAQAVSTLQSANLNPVVICQSTQDPTQDGLVQSQSPSGGKSVGSGTTVTITVASYPSCSATTSTTTGGTTTTTSAHHRKSR
ncbi:MAG TPA: Stk1 family PASTA domain-containing Ser/Thr kinase [Acidimicrobiales bacterium]|nr:Stk1 family PASTA domain-containing Ser/Thr kinase [Acidimicrobiales bacterium]